MTIGIIYLKIKLPLAALDDLLISVGVLLLLPLMEYVAAHNPLHNLAWNSHKPIGVPPEFFLPNYRAYA